MINTVAQYDTVEHADCVESCPIPGYEKWMCYGTYQLEKSSDSSSATDTRGGTIGLVEVMPEEPSSAIVRQTMSLKSGIFDMKWSHANTVTPTLAVATAGGTLELLTLDEAVLSPAFQSEYNVNSDEMFLSLDWNDRLLNSTSASSDIIVSQSNGKLSTWKVGQDRVSRINEWNAHNLFGQAIEVWITAYDAFNPNVAFSGADDTFLKGWDTRTTNAPVFQNRSHTMGVCSIEFNPHKEHVVATGSYDQKVRIWDSRQMKTPTCEYDTGGGVWRLKWHPNNHELLLTASMRNGFQILKVAQEDEGVAEIDRLVLYDMQSSLAYGVDWLYDPLTLKQEKPIVGSSSFYDHSFHVWQAFL